MTYHYLAFFMGLFGSVHCVVMCGPLIFATDKAGGFSLAIISRRLQYQLGRILMYGMLGLLLGTIGSLASMQDWQQLFSIFIGTVLICSGIIFLLGKRNGLFSKMQNKVFQPLVVQLSKWLYRPGGAFVAGLLNGVLPCGMVYVALISAMNADSVWNGFLFMVIFGLGTLPFLFIFSFAVTLPKNIFKRGFAKVIPFLYLLMGIWFVLRGAGLDIPYLSPLLHIEGALNCV